MVVVTHYYIVLEFVCGKIALAKKNDTPPLPRAVLSVFLLFLLFKVVVTQYPIPAITVPGRMRYSRHKRWVLLGTARMPHRYSLALNEYHYKCMNIFI